MIMFKKILVALDGSKSSRNALEKAFELCKTCKPAPALLAVSVCPVFRGVTSEEDSQALEKYFSKVQADAAGAAKKSKLKLGTQIVFGLPADEIVGYAKKTKADLIVMGNWGAGFKGDVSRMILGSVSAEVIKRTGMPVLVVK